MTRDCARRYHDPQLVALADQYGVTTELWALPWLFTIFASGVPISIVLHIWYLLLLSIDSAAPLYFACALVISQRETVLTCDPDALPLVMRNCLQRACSTVESVNDVWMLAENLMMATPQSFKVALHKVLALFPSCLRVSLLNPPLSLPPLPYTYQALTSTNLTHHVRQSLPSLYFCSINTTRLLPPPPKAM